MARPTYVAGKDRVKKRFSVFKFCAHHPASGGRHVDSLAPEGQMGTGLHIRFSPFPPQFGDDENNDGDNNEHKEKSRVKTGAEDVSYKLTAT